MNTRRHSGFSLVEVLAAVALIGIITFIALPNIVQIKQDSEDNLAITRAEAINLSIASYIQAQGQTAATTGWAGTAATNRYGLLAPYLAYAPASFTEYVPAGYSITLPVTLLPPTYPDGTTGKTQLIGPNGRILY